MTTILDLVSLGLLGFLGAMIMAGVLLWIVRLFVNHFYD